MNNDEINPMKELIERNNKMQECINKADKFVNDVMPQIGRICLQDYANLNEMCMLLTELKTDE